MFEPYYDQLMDGKLPECGKCRARVDQRVEDGYRQTTVPSMRPNVTLYGETHPLGERFAELINRDTGTIRSQEGQADLLLVVGTSLTVKGILPVIRNFSKALKDRFADGARVLYLNTSFPSQTAWGNIFDIWVNNDCQEFAQLCLDKMKREGLVTGVNRRFDPRPSWRWWSL
jgi:NAD-dependent SIR2 family protein deacetylase